jgi:hypothetical protein
MVANTTRMKVCWSCNRKSERAKIIVFFYPLKFPFFSFSHRAAQNRNNNSLITANLTITEIAFVTVEKVYRYKTAVSTG